VNIVSVNSLICACCKMQTVSVMNCTENVVGIEVFFSSSVTKAQNKEYLIVLFKHCPFLFYQVICEHFGENRVTL